MMTSTIKVILLCQNKTSSDGTKMSLCYFLVPWCLVTENIQPKVTTTSLAEVVELGRSIPRFGHIPALHKSGSFLTAVDLHAQKQQKYQSSLSPLLTYPVERSWE